MHNTPCWVEPAADWVGPLAICKPGTLKKGRERKRPSRTNVSDNCDAFLNFNQGCSVLFSNSGPSFGMGFNYNDGGYYVMSRSRDYGIQIWFWPRNYRDIPPEILWASQPLDPTNPTWGEPAANFPMDQGFCNYDKFFDAHQMVFDLTLCVRDSITSPHVLIKHD